MISRRFFLFFLIIFFSLIIRLYQIDTIPGEWFGDISNVHEYTQAIVKGEWPFYFFQSPGPLYHYLIAPLVLFAPYQGYVTYKLASVLVGMVGILGVYFLTKEMFSRRLALMAAWVMSFSFWPLVWARLGNSQVIIPGIFAFSSYFFLLFIKRRKRRHLFVSLFISSLGWYTYPQTFIFVPIWVLSYLCFLGITKQIIKRKGEIVLIFFLLLVLFLPFLNILKNQPDNFGASGYVGGKVLPVFMMDPKKAVGDAAGNFVHTLGIFATKGDQTFRVNVPDSPIIDKLSFVFLILGIISLIVHKKHLELLYFVLLICLLILPAVVPGTPLGEIPSSSRTIAIQPTVYLLISLGIVFCSSILRKKHKFHYLLIGGLVVAGIIICFLNLNKYFILYPENLPDKNLAPGKKIAQYLDREVPLSTSVYFGSCCWGAWGEPEPKAIAYVIRKPREYIELANILNCSQVDRLPALIIFGPNDMGKIEDFKKCFTDPVLKAVQLQNSQILFTEMTVTKRKADASNQQMSSF